MMARRPNLLIVRAGDTSLHERWLAGAARRNFDLLVSYYGSTPNRFNERIEFYHAMKGPRWPAHDALCTHQLAMLEGYDRVGFACDDLDANADTWNRMFDTFAWYELDLAQPSVQGHTSWDITRTHSGCLLRYTSFVEPMAPVFSRRALAKVRGTFGESISGWGLSFLWARLLPYPEYKTAVVDTVHVVHTSPIRQGTLRPTLDALGIDPEKERQEVMARHGIESAWIGEYARLRVSHGEE
jgi:hypothetical protein